MKRISLLLACVALAATSYANTASTVYRRAAGSVMTLWVKDKLGNSLGNGTGFLVKETGLVLTAYHVISDAHSLTAHFDDGTVATVLGVVDVDPSNDLALLQIKPTTRKPVPLAAAKPEIGSEIFVIGAPKGLEFSITSGIINQVRKESTIQFSAPVSPGNSGSPLLNEAGEAVGIVSYQRNDGQNLNFAIPAQAATLMDWNAKAKPFPLVASKAKGQDPKSWRDTEFAATGLVVKLPVTPGVIETEMDKDLQVLADGYKSTRLRTDIAEITLTYFSFRKGQCPSTKGIAESLCRDGSGPSQEVRSSGADPKILELSVPGADEAHGVVAAREEGRTTIVECTVICRKGTRMWVVVYAYDSKAENFAPELEAVMDSIRIKR